MHSNPSFLPLRPGTDVGPQEHLVRPQTCKCFRILTIICRSKEQYLGQPCGMPSSWVIALYFRRCRGFPEVRIERCRSCSWPTMETKSAGLITELSPSAWVMSVF